MNHDDPTLPPTPEAVADTEAPNGELDRRAEATGTSDPARVGRYVVVDRLGAGGMGVVYSAYDPKLDRKVAIKLLLPGHGGAEAQTRLLREAQAMAQLSHPNVVAVHDVGEHGSRVYVAMDFVRGDTLRAWLASRRRRWKDTLAMYLQAARGLAAAHDAGLVHRDLKPDNVLVDGTGRALVTDFGLARASVGAIDRAATEPRGPLQLMITREGALLGTPAYMAPEQFEGAFVDARADQFALCISLWEGLYTERPFAGENVVDLVLAVTKGQRREPPRGTRVPRWLRHAVQRGLAVDPDARWPSVNALIATLERGQARARLRSLAAGAVLLALVGVGVEAWRRAEHARTVAACDEIGASIAAVWPGESDAARLAVRDGLLATGVNHAATTFEKVQPWLDEFAHTWQGARTRACLHHDVERTWDDDLHARAEDCLDERRAELAALVQQLEHADATAAQKAVTASAGLERVDPCTDEATLARRPDLPAELREQVQGIRDALSRAGAIGSAGRLEARVSAARDALADSETVGWPPLLAESHAALGSALEGRGDYDAAERELVDAYVEAASSGAMYTAEYAATRLVFLVGVRRARFDDAILWCRLAEVERTRLDVGDEDPAVATRINNLASVHQTRGAYAEAQPLHERALAIRERVLGREHPAVAASLANLANLHHATGEYGEARTLFERALAIEENAFGSEHPEVAGTLASLAIVHHATGANEEAARMLERALTIEEKAFGLEHPELAGTLNNLATVRQTTGAREEAKRLYERALSIDERALGPEHPEVASALGNLARVHKSLGALAEAKTLQERALTIREKALGPDDPAVATSLTNLAAVLFETGAYAEAETMLERALAIYEGSLGPEHPSVAYALVGLGDVALAKRRPADAVLRLERALGLREKNSSPAGELAVTRFALANALWESNEERRALQLADRAADGFRELGREGDEQLAEVETWLAKRRAGR